MLTIHLLGHAHISRHNQPVPVSAKAVALIAYLAIEKLPQHRERLADLLWTTAEARKNLRVELARIRTAGLNLFPASRQLLYLEDVTTDVELWQARLGEDMNQAALAEWLAMLRGFPLSGLEDLGSSSFQEWVDQQRWLLSQQIEEGLSQVYWRYARAGQTWAMRLISARAETLGFELSAEPPTELHLPDPELPPTSAGPAHPLKQIHFERRHEEQELQRLFQAAEQAVQVVVLHGPPGAGKNYLTERLASRAGWLTLRVSDTRSSRLVLATLAQAILRESDPECAAALRRMLLAPNSLEEDTVKVAVALARLARPVLLLFDHAHTAPAELAPLLAFLTQMPSEGPRIFLLLSRQHPMQAPLTRALWGWSEGNLTELALRPLTTTSVQRALEAYFPSDRSRRLHSDAARLVQRSEGNPLHLLSLLGQTGETGASLSMTLPQIHFPQVMRDTYGMEIDQWPAPLVEGMIRLSAIYGHFDRRLAQAALGEPLASAVDSLLYEALERHILEEVEEEAGLQLPGLTPLPNPPGGETRYTFASEGLRIALASRSPQLLRQDVRRRLVPVLAPDAPGLAAYYAQRGGLIEEAERLQRVYRAQRQARQLPEAGQTDDLPPPAVAEPRRIPAAQRGPVLCQGYLVSCDEQSWLNICSVGRYGHPQTLRLLLKLPKTPAHQAELRLVWRLDVFSGGEELGPARTPFPLRVALQGANTAYVLARSATPDYLEDGVRHIVHPAAGLGQWTEHRLTFPASGEEQTLELSVRALDVALTLGALSWQGQALLPFAAHLMPAGVDPPVSPLGTRLAQ
ncbi:SARP family transcriptional regulator [Deinococcus sp. S9]|nr:SARP family transcriptional regulator [Deinococcus sp. S9]